jgi:anti-anti-sigma factor
MIYINHKEVLEGRVTIVDVSGPLDSETAADFEDYIRKLLEKNIMYILLDAGEISHVSSEGIGAMLFIQKRIAEKNGFFVIYNLNGEISALFSLLGFDKVMRIVSSRIEAMEIMDRQMELRDEVLPWRRLLPRCGGRDLKPEEFPPDRIPSLTQAKRKTGTGAPHHRVPEMFHPLISTRAPGEYLSPECRASFIVDADMGVSFPLKPRGPEA